MTKKKEIKEEDLKKVTGGVKTLTDGECESCHKTFTSSYDCNPIYVSYSCGVKLDHYECPDCGGVVHFPDEDLNS